MNQYDDWRFSNLCECKTFLASWASFFSPSRASFRQRSALCSGEAKTANRSIFSMPGNASTLFCRARYSRPWKLMCTICSVDNNSAAVRLSGSIFSFRRNTKITSSLYRLASSRSRSRVTGPAKGSPASDRTKLHPFYLLGSCGFRSPAAI